MFGLDPLIRMNWIRDSALIAVSGGKHKSTHPARPGSHAWPSSKLSCLPKLNKSRCYKKSSKPQFKVHFAAANGKHSALLHLHGVVCARRVHRQRHRRSLQCRPCGRRALRSTVPSSGAIFRGCMPCRKVDHAACIAWRRSALQPSCGAKRSYWLLQQCHARARGWTLMIQRYCCDLMYQFTHDHMSDLFADILAEDMHKLADGNAGQLSLAPKWCLSYEGSILQCPRVERRRAGPISFYRLPPLAMPVGAAWTATALAVAQLARAEEQ